MFSVVLDLQLEYSRELFEKLKKNLEEVQLTNTELYRKVTEDLKK